MKKQVVELNCLICKTINKPIKIHGKVERAVESDIPILSEYWYYAHLEMEGVLPITKKESTKYVEKIFSIRNIFCCKNPDNKIVSIGYYEEKNDSFEIKGIYTIPSERRNGYASNLVYEMTKEIIEKNKIPFLYTNKNYIPSNSLYKKIGYYENKE